MHAARGGTRVRAGRWLAALAGMVAVALAGSTALGAIGASRASGHVIQHQPAAGTCHQHGTGVDVRPDPRCTPGLRNPSVTQATIGSTICRSGWTSRVRPPAAITGAEKIMSMRAYGDRLSTSRYEYDHFLPLELGGAVNAPGNLWPEPDYPARQGFYLNPKDRLENALHVRVCARRMALATAQHLIVANWVSAYRTYVGATGSGGTAGDTAGGGYYASSFRTAHEIYCADDPAWRSLSPRYLVHFATLAHARARFPGRALHRPC